jgi:hypothetical protein
MKYNERRLRYRAAVPITNNANPEYMSCTYRLASSGKSLSRSLLNMIGASKIGTYARTLSNDMLPIEILLAIYIYASSPSIDKMLPKKNNTTIAMMVVMMMFGHNVFLLILLQMPYVIRYGNRISAGKWSKQAKI